jgi:7-carboxy-7-deazaguanine synthase
MTTDKKYPVIEVFGPTIQGEGAMAGRPTHFIRMGGCDYRCHWCDTDIAVLPEKVREEQTKLTAVEIVNLVQGLRKGPKWVTISGGNPALHQLDLLVIDLHRNQFKVAVETQGSMWKPWLALVDQLTISPKPPSSKMSTFKNMQLFEDFMDHMMTEYPIGSRVCLKIPVFDEVDYEHAMVIHQQWGTIPFYFSVVTKMGGLYGDFSGGEIDTRDTLLDRYKWLAERIAGDERAGDTVAIPQLHALLWGHGRGF